MSDDLPVKVASLPYCQETFNEILVDLRRQNIISSNEVVTSFTLEVAAEERVKVTELETEQMKE